MYLDFSKAPNFILHSFLPNQHVAARTEGPSPARAACELASGILRADVVSEDDRFFCWWHRISYKSCKNVNSGNEQCGRKDEGITESEIALLCSLLSYAICFRGSCGPVDQSSFCCWELGLW